MEENLNVHGTERIIKKVTFGSDMRAKVEWEMVVTFDDESAVHSDQVTNHPLRMHGDTIAAKDALKEHLARINGIEKKKWENLQVTSIRVDLDAEEPRGMIMGKLTTYDNQKLAMQTPFMSLESTQYEFKDKLLEALETLVSEVESYLWSGHVENPRLWDQLEGKMPKLAKVS